MTSCFNHFILYLLLFFNAMNEEQKSFFRKRLPQSETKQSKSEKVQESIEYQIISRMLKLILVTIFFTLWTSGELQRTSTRLECNEGYTCTPYYLCAGDVISNSEFPISQLPCPFMEVCCSKHLFY